MKKPGAREIRGKSGQYIGWIRPASTLWQPVGHQATWLAGSYISNLSYGPFRSEQAAEDCVLAVERLRSTGRTDGER